MEFLPLGPVLFIDTAGIDDTGALGELRIHKTRQIFDRTDLGVIVSEAGIWGDFEERLVAELKARNVPVIVVFNKSDLAEPERKILDRAGSKRKSLWSGQRPSQEREYWTCGKHFSMGHPLEFINHPAILGDLIGAGEMAVLVVPIDKEAPKGRLILPQVQAIRDLLDSDAYCMVVKERELRHALERLKRPPKLVVTDSQAFLKVAADTRETFPSLPFRFSLPGLKAIWLNSFVGRWRLNN